jgi:hypothetical protein
MKYYTNFSSQDINKLKELNDKIIDEEKKCNPNNKEILKLKQQILIKGMEMSVNFNPNNYNPYL